MPTSRAISKHCKKKENLMSTTLLTSWATHTARRQRRRRREPAPRTDASGPVRPRDTATRYCHRVCFSHSQIVNASHNGIESLKLIFQEPFLFDFILLCCSFLQTPFQVIKRNDTHLTKKFRCALLLPFLLLSLENDWNRYALLLLLLLL